MHAKVSLCIGMCKNKPEQTDINLCTTEKRENDSPGAAVTPSRSERLTFNTISLWSVITTGQKRAQSSPVKPATEAQLKGVKAYTGPRLLGLDWTNFEIRTPDED
jgi:hypothetical protein